MRRQHVQLAIIYVLALGLNSNATSAHDAGLHIALIKPPQSHSQFAEALLNLHNLEIQKSRTAAEIALIRSVTHPAISAPTTGIVRAAQDEVSARIAALFRAHGLAHQAASAQAAEFHQHLIDTLNASGKDYQLGESEAEALGHGHDPDVIELVTDAVRQDRALKLEALELGDHDRRP
jgi:PE family protein